MNHVAAILGISLPTLSAKGVVMRHPHRVPVHNSFVWGNHTDSLLLLCKERNKGDDETASTLSASDSDLSFSGNTVTFAESLVTDVYHRPYTTMEEKYVLFYNDVDYADFRRECLSGKRRNRLVSFADAIVSDVYEIPITKNPEEMFYTEAELQK
jgi:hypothetical protein